MPIDGDWTDGAKGEDCYTKSILKQNAGQGGGKCWPDAAKCASSAFPILENLTSPLELATHAIASSLRGSTMDGQ